MFFGMMMEFLGGKKTCFKVKALLLLYLKTLLCLISQLDSVLHVNFAKICKEYFLWCQYQFKNLVFLLVTSNIKTFPFPEKKSSWPSRGRETRRMIRPPYFIFLWSTYLVLDYVVSTSLSLFCLTLFSVSLSNPASPHLFGLGTTGQNC